MEAPWCAESCCEVGDKDGSTGTASAPVAGHHRLPLPPPAVQLSSTQGKQLFRAALLEGTAECYLRLAEVFYTQSEPAFCGLGTLVMVLNALEVDPGALWKGNWRWYDESMFGCCVDLEEVKKNGITWRPWCSLARAQGLHLTPKLAVNTTIDDFRDTVRAVTASDGDRVLVVNYSRRGVGQVGTGHFSPVGAFVAEHDMVLVLDVARFKHPPHFLPLETLWHAMSQKDPVTGFARGYAVLERARAHSCGKPHHGNGFLLGATGARCCGRLRAVQAYFGGAAVAAHDRRVDLPSSSAHAPTELPRLRRWTATLLGGRCWLPHGRRRPTRRMRDPDQPPPASAASAAIGTGALEAGRPAQSDGEELWLAIRAMPAPAAALVTLREALPAGAPAEERAHFEQSRAELACTRVHRALSEAAALFRTRDGPLPASIDVCAVLLLVLNAIVPEPQLRQALPRTASWLLEEPLLAHGNALAEDVSCMRGLLEDMAREMGDTWLGATPDLALSPPKAAPPLPVPRDASAATGGHAPVTPPSLCVV